MQVEVGGGSTSLDELGPVIVNKDGSLARIANWEQMTEEEQNTTMRLIGAQNRRRVAALQEADAAATANSSDGER